jgi:flagellar hook-associated protein 3 FlgL
MRVANKTIYEAIKFELSNVTERLYEANEIVMTGKRINSLSDDPVGLTQCLNIRSSLSNLEQLERNITTGRNWLDAGEIALRSINDLITSAKVLSVQMANDSLNISDRADAAEQIRGTLQQVLDLSNTMVDTQYIFAGTSGETKAFEFDNEENPTMVTYSGNDSPFTVKVGKDTKVAVGWDGEEIFCDSYVTIAESSDKIDFIEYLGGTPSEELTATVPGGKYSHDDLAAAIEQAMEDVSSQSGNSIDYVVTYDSATKKFTIQDDGTNPGFALDLMWGSGTNANTGSIAPEIGFDKTNDRDRLIESDNTVTTVTITGGTNDTIEFKEDVGNGLSATITATIPAGVYNTDVLLGNLANSIEAQMDAQSVNSVNYEVTYDATNDKFIIEEQGPNLKLKEVQILWDSGAATTALAATALGFDNAADDVYTPHTSDNEVQWGIFKTLIELKDYLEANDVDGIRKSMTRLDFHIDNLTSPISDAGFKGIQLDVKETVISDLNLSYMTRKSKIEDADIVEAVTDLKAREAAYQAALASSARVMQLSLMDYL